MEMYKWIDYYIDKHLTIGSLKVGEIMDVAMFDGNFEEYEIWSELKRNQNYSPEQFFKSTRNKIRYNGDETWDIMFNWGQTVTHPLHIDTSTFNTSWTWMVLDGKNLTITTTYNNGKITNLPLGCQQHVNYDNLPKSTRVGWRGPVMLWDDVIKGMDVYCYQEREITQEEIERAVAENIIRLQNQ